ncbi:hypothetical protein [Sodalis sp.]|uniref:hypothetical protein n=1 Tax=Sodalis sp. (in: enterobacteria) TaxID=1898979 RepID=UPI003872FDF8
MNEEAYEIVTGIGKLLYGLFVAFVTYKTIMLVAPLDAEFGVKVLLTMLIFTAAIIVSMPLASVAGMFMAFLWASSYVAYRIIRWTIHRIRALSARPLP